jgi:hypothetical protein
MFEKYYKYRYFMESIFWFVAAGKSYRIFRMTDTRFINEYIYVYVLSFQIVLHE